MANEKQYAQWIDIPDGNGSTERKWFKDQEARDANLHPVDVNTLTPSSTFVKNAIIGINGVIYRSKVATSHFPVVLQTSGNAFVVETIDGKIAFVVTDSTIDSDWEQWTDAAIEYWIAQLSARTTSLETRASALETAMTARPASITYNDVTYTATELLTAMAQLMTKQIVVGD